MDNIIPPNDTPLKRCPRCPEGQQWYPATTEYFHSQGTGLCHICKACNNQRRREYSKTHKEQTRQNKLRYRNANRERINEYYREYEPGYRASHREQVNSKARRYRERHPEKIREYDETHREERAQYGRKHYRNNLSYYYMKSCIRYAREQQAEGFYAIQDVQVQYERQNGTCHWCKTKLYRTKPAHYHVDHIIPLTRGGTNWPDNLVLACPRCNRSKSNKLPHEWLFYRWVKGLL